MKVQILDARVEFIRQPFIKPMQISSGLISEVTEARACVRVSVDGREGVGIGSIYLSDLWAWPGSPVERPAKAPAMRAVCSALAADLAAACGGEPAHPLELSLRLHHHVSAERSFGAMPALARAVCASPFDAAIHDATGQALGVSAFRLYDEAAPIPSADAWFPEGGACVAVRRLLSAPPRNELDAWWIVGANDDLETDIRPVALRTGIGRFKLKILGRDLAADAARTLQVWRTARSWGIARPELSIDGNEGCAGPDAVNDYLDRIEAESPEAYSSIRYIEQPSSRDIRAHVFDWSSVARRAPVVLDEGLSDLALLPEAKAQGWSGLALKTCKGHGFALVCAAWAVRNGLSLTLQDLTNPGYAAIHSFLIGSRVPTINGIELNSPQYTPAANAAWLPEFSGLFEPREGRHRIGGLDTPGLGSALLPRRC